MDLDPVLSTDTDRVAQLRAWDDSHHLHPFTDHKSLRAQGSRFIERGEGVWIWDTAGHRILDAMAGLWNVNVGYGRPELVDAATRQMQALPFYNSFFKSTTVPAVELARRLIEIAPKGFSDVMYASSGSEAIDTMIRMVRHFWVLEGKPDKQILIARRWAYHGSTIAAASLGGMTPMHEQLHTPLPGIRHVMPPYPFELQQPGESDDDFGLRAARDIERVILEEGPDRVAAVIGEPIMGAGGVKIPPRTYWPEVERICRKYDVLLVSDEVICGYGRLGTWFGCQYFGVTPDLMTSAKALTSGYFPLSALFVGERVSRTLVQEGGEFYHGYTNAGHPVGCAIAIANLDVIQKEGLVERVRDRTGPYLAQRLQAVLGDHPIVGEVRSVGLVGAIELVGDRQSRTRLENAGTVCRDHCFKNDLIMRAVEHTMILSPPLVITEAEIDELVARARIALDLTARDFQIPVL